MPTLFCSSFSLSCLFSLLVPLSSYIMLLCLALCTMSCTFSYTIRLVLHLLDHSYAMSTYKSCDFDCSFSCNFEWYICPYGLAPQICCQPIIHLAASHVSYLPRCLICNAPLSCTFVESKVLNFCLERLSNSMSCTFDLYLWMLCLVLHLCLAFSCLPRFCAQFSCTVFLPHLVLALWFLLPCTLNSYYVHKKSCNFALFLKSLCLASWACLSTICFAPSIPLSINCLAPCTFILHLWSSLSCTVNSNVYPYILHFCLLPLSCPSNTYFALLACIQCISNLTLSTSDCHFTIIL